MGWLFLGIMCQRVQPLVGDGILGVGWYSTCYDRNEGIRSVEELLISLRIADCLERNYSIGKYSFPLLWISAYSFE